VYSISRYEYLSIVDFSDFLVSVLRNLLKYIERFVRSKLDWHMRSYILLHFRNCILLILSMYWLFRLEFLMNNLLGV